MKPLSSFLLAILPLFSLAQNKNLLTPELLWKLKRVGEYKVSPNGKQVVYTVRTYDISANKGNADLYIINTNGEGTPQLIAGGNAQDFSPKWRPDGLKIGFLSNRTGEVQLWEMDADGKNAQQVTFISGGINGFGYAPSLDRIFFIADVKLDQTVADKYPDLPLSTGRIIDGLMFRHWDSWHDYAYSHVFIANYIAGRPVNAGKDIMEGERYDSPLQPFGDDEQISFNTDGTQLAYTCKKMNGTAAALSTNSDIYLYGISSGKTQNLTQGMMGYDVQPKFSPDGKQLMWLSMQEEGYEADRNRLFVMELSNRSKRELTDMFIYPVEKAEWSHGGKRILFIAAREATQQIFECDLSDRQTTFITQLTYGFHDYTDLSVSSDKKPVVVGARMSISMPTELFLIPARNKDKQLTFTNKELLSGIKMGTVLKRLVKTTDGKLMHTWVIYPPDFDSSKKYPALLYCQGGPQSTVSQFFSYRWNFQLMAAKGYIVVAPNRRGLPSFGEEWNDQIQGDYGGQPMRDLLSAIDDVAKERYVNKEKLGCVGASFGGFSVYWMAGNHQHRFKAFIAHCGMFNMESWYGSTEELFFANRDMEGPYWRMPQPANFAEHSPHHFVRNWDAPMLVIHNEKDFRVPFTQGIEAFTAAQLQGVPSKFLYFADENHWVTKPQNGILWQRVFFEWLDSYLK